ncbi:MAG: extracellular solute-binding protein [Actinomycetota bacterium]
MPASHSPAGRRPTRGPTRRLAVTASATAVAAVLAACTSTGDGAATSGTNGSPTLTIYSGRNENLVAPLLDELEATVGTNVEVRYAGSSELSAQLLEEGERTDADLFLSQDAGALGALANADRLTELPTRLLDRVQPRFRDADGQWVATSARARVLAFDPAQAPEVADMTSIDDLLDERYRGLIGYAPTNASFHSFVTALRVDRGETGAREWLERFADLDPQAYEGNTPVLDAVDGGQVAIGLINHYYWYARVAEQGADAVAARIHFLGSDDPGALVNVAGVGVLEGSDAEEGALAAVEFLLSEEAQQYFADSTAEYPVVDGVASTVHDLAPLSDGLAIDLNSLDSLAETLALLDEVGLT